MRDLTEMTLAEIRLAMRGAMSRAMRAGVDNDIVEAQKAMEEHARLWAERENRAGDPEGPACDEDEELARAAERSLNAINVTRRRVRASQASFRKILKHHGEPDERDDAEMSYGIAMCEVHLADLERRENALRADPRSVFLPAGTTVAFNGVEIPRSGMSPGTNRSRHRPVAGTVGVVIGAAAVNEFSLLVAIARDWETRDGAAHTGRADLPTVYYADRSHIDVIGPGLRPDGSECRALVPEATHMCEDGGEASLIFSDGLWWALRLPGDDGEVDVMCAREDIGAVPGIEGPIGEANGIPHDP